jgi:Nif-specific regulatory protein
MGGAMARSFAEFKFYQSYRIPVENLDEIRFILEKVDDFGHREFIEDSKLVDLSLTGLGFRTKELLPVDQDQRLSANIHFRKINLEVTGRVVRAFTDTADHKQVIYGMEIDKDCDIRKFLEQYILSFPQERLRDCLVRLAVGGRYTNSAEGLELFSLFLSIYKDIANYAQTDGFIDTMLEEVCRLTDGTRGTLYLINPHSNELEAYSALGTDKHLLKMDYRRGIAGSVFTTGVALNVDTTKDPSRFDNSFDEITSFRTKSIICHPIHNKEDKIIGVIEILNKKSGERFTEEDEEIMKVVSLVFSSVFGDYNPISEGSMIRRFSTPFDRDYALVGKTAPVNALRSAVIKLKDLNTPILVRGEYGVGKTLLSKIIHSEGSRGLNPYEVVDCLGHGHYELRMKLFGEEGVAGLFEACRGGTIVLKNVEAMPLDVQAEYLEVIRQGGLPGSKISVDVRTIATTVQDVEELARDGHFSPNFREYFSRAVVLVKPLRQRKDDIPEMLNYFLKMECRKQGQLLKSVSQKVLDILMDYDWPENVAELRRCVERAVMYNPKSHVIRELPPEAIPLFEGGKSVPKGLSDIPFVMDHKISLKDRLAFVEKELINAEIKRCSGNKSQAAKAMGMSREALRKKLLAADEAGLRARKVSGEGEKKAA